jgi:hypothetical protein
MNPSFNPSRLNGQQKEIGQIYAIYLANEAVYTLDGAGMLNRNLAEYSFQKKASKHLH